MSPSPDFEAQLEDLTGEFDNQLDLTKDSQLSIAKGPATAPPPKPARSTLLNIPPGIQAIRRCCFDLKKPIAWTRSELNLYWPYIDNIWVRNQTRPPTKKKTQAVYYWCRFWAGPQKSEGIGERNKSLRSIPPCPMKMKVIQQLNSTGDVESVSLSLLSGVEHNHTLEYVDATKLNEGVKQPIKEEVSKGYNPAIVHRNLQGVKWTANHAALEAAGGAALDLKAVHNAGCEFRRANPDFRIRDANAHWQDQMGDCYEGLQRLGEEYVSQKLTAKRILDNKISHAVVYANRGECPISPALPGPNYTQVGLNPPASEHLRVLMRRGHLFLMDSTHNTNALKWKLFSLLVRDEQG